jgi:hypothetical protein
MFTIFPDKKRAYAVFTNGNNTDRARYVRGMHSLLDTYKKAADKGSGFQGQVPDLDEFEGFYQMMPWIREMYVTSWCGRLVVLSLPSDDPAEYLIELKYTGEDTFRRIRDDGKLGESYEFERDDQSTCGFSVPYTFPFSGLSCLTGGINLINCKPNT